MKKITAITALVAAILAIGSYAGAAIVNNGVVNACYYTGSGNIRVDGDGVCPTGQKPIKLAQGGVSAAEVLTWNATNNDDPTSRTFNVGDKITVTLQTMFGTECIVKAGTQVLATWSVGSDYPASQTATITASGAGAGLVVTSNCTSAKFKVTVVASSVLS